MELLDVILLVISIVLIWGIMRYWPRTKQQREPSPMEYARASDVYNKLLTNDNNVFKLMTDFNEPVSLIGPDGQSTSTTVESTDISLLDRFSI